MPQLVDPNFNRTVILLCKHTPQRAFGLVVNRPLVTSGPVVVEVRTEADPVEHKSRETSDRELQVFQMLGSGMSTRQVAAQLHLSFKTVETHRENIKHKLGLRDSAELVRHAAHWVQRRPSGPSPRL